MRRDLFTEDHEAFRGLARDFVEKEVVPNYPEWERGGRMPRDVFKQMGALGMLGMAIPEEYGGGGMPDYRYNVVLQEEAARALVTLSTVRTQLEVILPYFLHYANAEQRDRWFPGMAAGTLLTAPIPATEKVLKRSGLGLADIGVYEVNEAFAPVPLAWLAETGGDESRLNPLGGAIALGHPLGGSGAVLMTRMLHHMRDNGIRYGLQTMCEGGGTANATIVELLP